MTKNFKNRTKLTKKIIICIALVMSLFSMGGMLLGVSNALALSQEVTSWSNLNFSSNNNLSNVYTTPTGWQTGFTDFKGTL